MSVDIDREHAEVLSPAATRYLTFCLAAAGFMMVPLLLRGMTTAALFPSLFALGLPLLRWRLGPWLLLGAIGWTILADRLGLDPFMMLVQVLLVPLSAIARRQLYFFRGFLQPRLTDSLPALDVLFCAAVLVWMASYFRLLSVTWTIFPIDRRRMRSPGQRRLDLEELAHRRRAEPAGGEEIAWLLMTSALCAVAAQLVLRWLARRNSMIDLGPLSAGVAYVDLNAGLWQTIVLMWLFGTVLLVVTGVLGYLGQRRMTPAEAELYLQDQLWRQVRREAARTSRWLAWAEQRAAKRRAKREEPQ